MASTVTRSQSNSAPLVCPLDVVEREIRIMDVQPTNLQQLCVMLSCQYGPKSMRNVSNTLFNLCHKELS